MTDATITRRDALAVTAAAAALSTTASADDAMTVFVTGSNRGIGLEFVKQYAAKGWNVIATTRSPDKADELKKVAASHKNVTIEALDVSNNASVDALAAKLKGKPIDLLINNAGITGDFSNPKPQSFGTLDFAEADNFLHTNALGALKVTEAFYENVKLGKGKKIVAVTSLAGSFGAKFGGGIPGGYWYKISKAALNAAMVNVSMDAAKDGVIVALLSPGTVRVEKIANARMPGLIEPVESIGGMIKVIDGLQPSDAGAIIRYTGDRQPY
ncbi:MAG: SDR family oxidoreductase [Rhodospirillaceae bacterium]|nr:SDR family oxidoreductase [Rhodospirillaceae bacterium]